jgi:hypothetical protein
MKILGLEVLIGRFNRTQFSSGVVHFAGQRAVWFCVASLLFVVGASAAPRGQHIFNFGPPRSEVIIKGPVSYPTGGRIIVRSAKRRM